MIIFSFFIKKLLGKYKTNQKSYKYLNKKILYCSLYNYIEVNIYFYSIFVLYETKISKINS
jgi:hypothetical protein